MTVASRRFLVTGPTGFLGGWVVKDLLARGADVVALVRHPRPESAFFADNLYRRAHVVRGRADDANRLRNLVAVYEVDAVIHLAPVAPTDVGRPTVVPVSTLPEPLFRTLVPVRLPAVFGPGCRNGWVARVGRGEIVGDVTAPVIAAREAAAGLIDAALKPAEVGGWYDLPAAASAAEFLTLVRQHATPGPRLAGDPLADAVAEWLAWCRAETPAAPLARAA